MCGDLFVSRAIDAYGDSVDQLIDYVPPELEFLTTRQRIFYGAHVSGIDIIVSPERAAACRCISDHSEPQHSNDTQIIQTADVKLIHVPIL